MAPCSVSSTTLFAKSGDGTGSRDFQHQPNLWERVPLPGAGCQKHLQEGMFSALFLRDH